MNKYKKAEIFVGEEFLNEYKLNNSRDYIYEYQDEICNNIINLSEENFIFSRESEEFLLIIDRTKKEAYYKLKELNYELDIMINYFDKLEENNKLIIAYQLETDDKEIKIILS